MIQNRNPYLNHLGARPSGLAAAIRHPNAPLAAQSQGFPLIRNTNNTIPIIQNQPNFLPPRTQINQVQLPTAIIPTQLAPIISNELDLNNALISEQHPYPSGVAQVSSQIFSPIAEGVPLNLIQSGGETMLTSVVTRPLITSRVREGLNYPTSIIHKIAGQTDSLILQNNSVIYQQIQSVHPSQISHFPVAANGMLGTITGKNLLMSQHKIMNPQNVQIVDTDPITPGIQTSPGLVIQTGPSRIVGNVGSSNNCCPWWCWVLFFISFMSVLSVGGYYFYKKYFKRSKKHRSHINKNIKINKVQFPEKTLSSSIINKKQPSKKIQESSKKKPDTSLSNKTLNIKQFTDPVDQIDNTTIKTANVSKLSSLTNVTTVTKSKVSKHHIRYLTHQ